MDVLSAAAAATPAVADTPADPAVVPDDDERAELPSDDEEGPDDVDDEADARAPGDAEDEDDEDEPPPTTAAAAAATGVSSSASGIGGNANCDLVPPQLPTDIGTLRVADLRQHLWWRKQPTTGNKEPLKQRLQESINRGDALRSVEDARAAGNAPVEAGGAAKVQWEPLDASKVTRPTYTGADKFTPRADLGLTHWTHPFEFMDAFYPKSLRDLEVANSARYRGYIKMVGKEIYPGRPDISVRTNSLAHAMLLCQGGNPVPDQRRMFKRSFFYKEHRGADLLTRDEWCFWKAYFHISNPADAPKFGTPQWDELHKVRPMLDEYLKRCVANITCHGRTFSIDEITIGFQGHHARLKLRCGKFKRAGDGFQVSRPQICLNAVYLRKRNFTFVQLRDAHSDTQSMHARLGTDGVLYYCFWCG